MKFFHPGRAPDASVSAQPSVEIRSAHALRACDFHRSDGSNGASVHGHTFGMPHVRELPSAAANYVADDEAW